MATTTEDETTMTIRTPDGQETGPFTTEDLERARDRLRDETPDEHPDGKLFEIPSDLSFKLGTGSADEPDFGTVTVKGQLRVTRDLLYTEHVTVTVTDARGEVIVSGAAAIGYPAFKDHYDKYGTKTVERAHTATLDAG